MLPPSLGFFDLDASGKIESAEVFLAVKSWVDEWRSVIAEEPVVAKNEVSEKKVKKCDINNDGECSLTDLSVLLFYIQS